jgi:hypothetical protein
MIKNEKFTEGVKRKLSRLSHKVKASALLLPGFGENECRIDKMNRRGLAT